MRERSNIFVLHKIRLDALQESEVDTVKLCLLLKILEHIILMFIEFQYFSEGVQDDLF